MSLTEKFFAWYQRYLTEITWFLIGNVSIQFAEALEKNDLIGAAWCAVIAFVNYSIWKKNR